MLNNTLNCPLCGLSNHRLFHKDQYRQYFLCDSCKLTFTDPNSFLPSLEEKKRYDLHQNSPEDLEYRKFLNRVFSPLQKRLPKKSYGLDFGCGPGPTLSVMFEEAGFFMNTYDIFYKNTPEVFEEKYDFITATEVFEHLHHPQKELDRLWGCLKQNGNLGVMTKLSKLEETSFSKWHYKNDPTHVSFFSKDTFLWIAKRLNAEIDFVDKDVILLKKL